MPTLFISDLHLSPEKPGITRLLLDFLSGEARQADRLYILGDLFEVWLGDDMVLPDYQPAIAQLKQLSETVPIQVMHGNRDFLMRAGFTEMSGCQLLSDAEVIDLYGKRTLLLHGDTLCTDDTAYQDFRRMVRNSAWQDQLLSKSPAERLALAKQYREASNKANQDKSDEIMDVNRQTVTAVMQEFGVTHLIHGHTHRPAVHNFELNGQVAERIVLGDWGETGSVLVCDAAGCRLKSI
ncbi:MAG: UDP-2,3-diacylglucosamine diphosphatase [Gammaproteobacteria bacterium]|nr:UDP-2,3-diacylglucosamine diphosphatase [Gammaproteobacteria bacterium]MDH5650791.1 UDP-2,3-diacylglucosamine diphosphatase [Gammaproteobacteria bacterium]